MTLYLKYRPQTLDELDSVDVRESLKKIFSSRSTPHAFLFAGPKGTGKTSAARIVAMILNCEAASPRLRGPCGKCEQCISIAKGNNLDVVEMDAASHRGIDDIRILRDVVKLSPAKAKKKIYIIDEAHMLTTEASNALLKTLEEPPSHVIFILATTNPDKLIETIRSRTTLVSFRKASLSEIKASLARVVKGEKMKINENIFDAIAKAAGGSFRDAIKILEQVDLEGTGFLEKGKVSGVSEFKALLYKKDLGGLLSLIGEFVNKGGIVENFLAEILAEIQKDLVLGKSEGGDLVRLAELLIEANRQIADSPIEELPLEIAVVKWCGAEKDVESGVRNEEEDVKEMKSVKAMSIGGEVWKNILSQVRPINASIEALLRAARPVGYDGKTLTLGVYYKFHKERLEDNTHRMILEDVVGRVLNSPTRVACTLVEPPPRTEAVLTESVDNDIIKAAEEIFGV